MMAQSIEEAIEARVRTAIREETRALREALERLAPPDDSEYLTAAQVAKLTKFDEDTVRRWMRTGKLPSRRVGSRKRVRRSDLERFLAKDPGGDERTPDEIADELLARGRR